VAWRKTPHRRRRDAIAVEGGSPALPIRADLRVKLVTSGVRFTRQPAIDGCPKIETGRSTIDGIAAREEQRQHDSENQLISYSHNRNSGFLAPPE
jgi:hypothetical protein